MGSETCGSNSFRKSASIRVITGQTPDPFDSLAYNSSGSRYVSPESNHTHEAGKEKDLIIIDTESLKAQLFLSIFRVFEKKFVFSPTLFTDGERKVLDELGVEMLRYDKNHFVVISFGDLNLVEILKQVKDVHFRIKLKNGFENKLPFSINMGGEEERVWQLAQELARKLSSEIRSMSPDELEAQIKKFVLSHELEHMRHHLSCSKGVSIEEVYKYLRSLELGLATKREELSDSEELDILDQKIGELKLLVVRLSVYSEALSILSEFSYHVTEANYKLQVLPILFRILRFFCSFKEKNSGEIFTSLLNYDFEDQPIHYVLATLSIFFQRDFVSEEKLPPISEVLSKIEEAIADPENLLTFNEWQTLHTSFEIRLGELYVEVQHSLDGIKNTQKQLGVRLIKPFI